MSQSLKRTAVATETILNLNRQMHSQWLDHYCNYYCVSSMLYVWQQLF